MVALPGATKSSPGTVGVDSVVAGVRVSWGDWVVGDVDGVVVVPGSALEATIAAGQKRAAGEVGYFAALRQGATTLELLGLDASLVDEGGAST
jgi:4-hydroxy-4-methyl-2-oxoglutarate aldolase